MRATTNQRWVSLFGFDYVWELFLPPAKRRWGWYVLPILFRDRLVGRIEPRIDRDEGVVRVLNLWWEDRCARTSTSPGKPARVAPHLSRGPRLLLTRP